MEISTAGPVVLDTLQRACSQNTEILKPAEQQLKEWETQPGFYSVLSSIFSNHSIDVNIRWLAVLYFKNGVDRYWRKTASNAISEEEKTMLRQLIVSNFNEPVNQIGTQLAVLIAKIARFDCPRAWPELIPTLLEAVKCDDELFQQRALLTLHHVIKTLASKRLLPDRKVFEDLANNIFSYMLNLWNTKLCLFLESLQQQANPEMLVHSLDMSMLALKVLRKLMVFGFREPREVEDTMTFLHLVLDRCTAMLECKSQIVCLTTYNLGEKREKCLNLLTKVLLDSQETHPVSFIPLLTPCLEFVTRYNFTDAGKGLVFERFTVNCLVLMKNILRCETYRPAKSIEDTANPATVEAYKIKMQFFTETTLSELCRILIGKYFLYTMEDLSQWDSDPEDFVSAESGDSWKYSLRPCTEVIYLTIFKEFRDTLTPIVMSMVKDIPIGVTDDLGVLLKKDAVYNAVGLASFDLFDEINFDQWFTSHLIPELHQQGPMYRLIRRRVVWLIGEWISVKLSPELRPTLYESILSLLKQGEDVVVRIQAANTLRMALDDFEFKAESYLPYLESTFSLLFNLLKEVVECETKMQVLNVMSLIIQRSEKAIQPYAEHLLRYLPLLWDASADHNMLRCVILSTLVHLVQGLGIQCVSAFDFLLPVIQLATDMSQDPHVYLLEDGLELWRTTLHNSPNITPGLLQTYKNMPHILDIGTEHLRICLKIIESYIYLGPKEFLQEYSTSLVNTLSSLITDIRVEGVAMVMKVVDLVFRLFPIEGPQIFKSMLANIFKNILQGEEYPVLMSVYLAIMSRVLLQNADFFWSFLEEFAKEFGTDNNQVLGKLLDIYFDKLDNITQPERRKLLALSVASLLTSNLGVVLERFGGMVNLLVEVLHDVCRLVDDDSNSQIDCLVLSEDDPKSDEEVETEHDKRKRQALRGDPVHTVSLKDYVARQLSCCQRTHGQQGFTQLMDLVDTDIAHQLKFLLR